LRARHRLLMRFPSPPIGNWALSPRAS
jgi:hypothetical protein